MPIGLIVHGGAGDWKEADHAAALAGCRQAVEAGLALLLQGRSALDAVEAAVLSLEANPIFNAGYGAVLNRDGIAQMDALIMDGDDGRFGAVAAVERVEHPITLARYVMERTPHHFLAGPGAELFAAEQGIALVDPARMIAPRRLDATSDTVGAVALDEHGNVAAAVSTGGIHEKLPGRIGDTPIAGAGGYADNMFGAASATGVGEGIMRSLLTFRAVEALATFRTAQSAADAVMPVFERYRGNGGLIVIDRRGQVGAAHNTQYMPTAWIDGDRISVAISQHSPAVSR
ncbi:MAG: isoaspartyl peptidase/L-asparaginase [Anaerolineae bacterium]|nr:isoaspartyl peptidase/L-asparaginase [Anaerolineae bacterium]